MIYNYFVVGKSGEIDFKHVSEAVARAQELKRWRRVTTYDSDLGSSPAVSTRSNRLTVTSGNFTNIKNNDLWVNLGDDIYHKIAYIDDDNELELEDYVDDVPSTIVLTIYRPVRTTIDIREGAYNRAIRMDKACCITFIGSNAHMESSELEASGPTDPTTICIAAANNTDATEFQSGELNIFDLDLGSRQSEVAGIFDGAVLTKGYNDTDPVSGVPTGRIHVWLDGCKIQNNFGADGVSFWHCGNLYINNCSVIAPEQCIETITTDRSVIMNITMESIRNIGDGHYQCGVVAAYRWDQITDSFKVNVVMSCNVTVANAINTSVFHNSANMGAIGILFATAEAEDSNQTGELFSIGNTILVDIPTAKHGAGLRVSNYNTSGTNGLKIKSFYDSVKAIGDTTNHKDFYADRGLIDYHHFYGTPSTQIDNSGIITGIV